MIKLYTNYALTGIWMKSNEKDTKLVAMATVLYREKLKNSHPKDRTTSGGKKPRKNPKETFNKRPPLDPWRFTFSGKNKTDDGVKYKVCPSLSQS